MTGEPIARLRVGIVAVLGRSGEAESLAYLRDLVLPRSGAPRAGGDEPDAASGRRQLADPGRFAADGRWRAGAEMLAALAQVDRRPETSEPYRNAILLGLRLQANGGELVARLLEKWIGQTPYKADAPIAEQLAAWQAWYANDVPQRAAGRAAQGIATE